MNSGADTGREEDAARRLDLPAGVEVSVAGVTMEVIVPPSAGRIAPQRNGSEGERITSALMSTASLSRLKPLHK